MKQPDFYQTLGVSESASRADIKKAFRKLAKECHPDRHKGDPKKEERFKEISEAYETLSDDKKRAEYDNIRRYGGFAGPGGRSAQGAGFGGGPGEFHFSGAGLENIEDLLGSFFGGAQSRRSGAGFGGFGGFGAGPFGSGAKGGPQRGADASAELSVEFLESLRGVSRQVTLANGGAPKTIKVKIPAGISDGEKIRLRGLGAPGVGGGPAGDLLVTIHVKPDQNFKRDGLNIITSVTIPLKVAALGGKARVKTLTREVNVNVPAGSQPGSKLRLKNQGVSANGSTGDLIVELQVEIPTKLTDDQRKLFEGL